MRFLVTRPQPECRQTADFLRAAGHVADELPLLVMHAQMPERFDLSDVSAVAFTSRRAVALTTEHQQFSDLKQLPVFAVGSATAKVCEEAGFQSIKFAEDGVASLGQLILDSQEGLAPGCVLYPAAQERAGDLEGILEVGNVQCRPVITYRMDRLGVLPDEIARALDAKAIDGALIFSKRTADTLVSLIKKTGLEHIFSDLSVYAISRQAAEPLSMYMKVRVADMPCQSALLDLVLADC
ncbi:uroporphyrinogen-III synthase [Roseibium album]|nr:uroporphyrinogen-III synthase [Roseibium album]